MRSSTLAIVLALATAPATAVPVGFSGVFGSNAPNTRLTAPEMAPFAVRFDAPAMIGSAAVAQMFEYSFGQKTIAISGFLTVTDNGNGTQTLTAQIFQQFLGVVFNLTAPTFVSGGKFVGGSYTPSAASGTAIIGPDGTRAPFSILRTSSIVITGPVGVAEAPSIAVALFGLGLLGFGMRRRALR